MSNRVRYLSKFYIFQNLYRSKPFLTFAPAFPERPQVSTAPRNVLRFTTVPRKYWSLFVVVVSSWNYDTAIPCVHAATRPVGQVAIGHVRSVVRRTRGEFEKRATIRKFRNAVHSKRHYSVDGERFVNPKVSRLRGPLRG